MFFYVFAVICCFFFFFQAEDGIRDVAVTGVQTCALPISQRDAQHLRMLVAPQPARERDRVGAESGAKRNRLIREPGAAEQIDEPWTRGEGLGEEFRACADAD